MASVPLKLSTIKPDFESLLLQLQLFVQDKETWQDMLTSGTGETLLECMAAVGTFNQFAIESAARESFLHFARRASSIYAITRMLGVRIHRKVVASATCQLTRPVTRTASEVLPKFTEFSIGGNKAFNRYPIMFEAGSSYAGERLFLGKLNKLSDGVYRFSTSYGLDTGDVVTVLDGTTRYEATYDLDQNVLLCHEDISNKTVSILRSGVQLYIGTLKTSSYQADTTKFREIYLPDSAFVVSDVDVQVIVVDPNTQERVLWSLVDDGIWAYGSEDSVYADNTDATGRAIISFGDGIHGKLPVLGSTIEIKYATCSGSLDNQGVSGLTVTCATDDEISGITSTTVSGGSDEQDASFYRHMAPYIFKARRRAVTQDDYVACSLDFPGVVSASSMGQRDIAPNDLRWMNVIRVCLLPLDSSKDAFTTAEWDEFETYMANRAHEAVHIQRWNPTPLEVEVELVLVIKQQYLPSAVVPLAEAAVSKLFKRRKDTLGRLIAADDIAEAAKVDGVDYTITVKCKIKDVGDSEVYDLTPSSKLEFLKLSSLVINTQYSKRSQYVDSEVIS